MMCRFGRVALIVAVVLFAVPGAGESLEKVRYVALEGIGRMSVEAMKIKGFDKDNGIEVEFDTVLNPAGLYTAINGKKFDIGHGAWSSLAKFRTQGTDVLMVAAITKMDSDVLVPIASSIKGFGDLKGKRVGLFGGPAAASTISLRLLLKDFYATDMMKDVTIHFAAEPNLFALAERGDVDAVASLDPNAAKQLLTGKFRSIGSVGGEWERRLGHFNTSSVLVTYDSVARSRPQIIPAFLKAYRATTAYLLSDESLPLWRAYAQRVGITGEDGVKLLIQRSRRIMIFEWSGEYIEQLKRFAQYGMDMLGKEFLPYFPGEAFTLQYVGK
jgi:NitT/TauT family transport system substrate-binding protein